MHSKENEKIVFTNASISTAIIVCVNIILSMFTELWDYLGSLHKLIAVILLAVLNVVGYAGVYSLVNVFRKRIWWKTRYKAWNLDGKWYGIQTMPDDECYFRWANITIEQRFFTLHIVADTHNVQYDPKTKEVTKEAFDQPTHWTEDSAIDLIHRQIKGIYEAERFDTPTLKGSHQFSPVLDEYDEVTRIEGWFIDIAGIQTEKPRCGFKVSG